MEITYRKLDDLTPYENNPRFNDEAVDAVAASIREFGFKVPIVLDAEGVIVAGHTRWKAAKKLGMEEVPCVVADDLTPEQVRAFRLADNKTAELADWNEEALQKELAEIMDIDMTLFGFTEDGEDGGDEEDDTYTSATNIPQYEVTGEKPTFAEMLDTSKADELIAEIRASGVTDQEKDFLIQAARRHNVFQYKNIAEYYAQATPEMQELMEKSALVIIDIDDAIKNGFVRMSEAIGKMAGLDDDE